MSHMSAFVLVVGFLILGFLAMTAVFIVMTDDPDAYDESVKTNRIDQRKHQMMLLSSEDEERKTTMRVFTVPSTAPSRSIIEDTNPTTNLTTLAISTTKIPVKFMRISPVTLKLNNSIFHGIVENKSESRTTPKSKILTFPMDPISEIKVPSKSGKIITLLLRNDLLYFPMTNGEIRIYNSKTYELVQDFKTPFAFRNFGFFNQSYFVAAEGKNNKIILIDDRSVVKAERKLDYILKDLQAFENQIYILSRTNEEIHVYNDHLEETQLIHFTNHLHETCNFIILTRDSIFVSCQTGILELDHSGQMKRKLKAPGGSYSLAISLHKNSLFAVQRGQQEIHNFNLSTGELEKKFISKTPGSAIWSALVINDRKFLLFERITNTVKVLSTVGLQ